MILALLVQRHELNLFHQPISGRYVAVVVDDHELVRYGVTGSSLTAVRSIVKYRISELLPQRGPELCLYPPVDVSQ
jgi:hypothetical protein